MECFETYSSCRDHGPSLSASSINDLLKHSKALHWGNILSLDTLSKNQGQDPLTASCNVIDYDAWYCKDMGDTIEGNNSNRLQALREASPFLVVSPGEKCSLKVLSNQLYHKAVRNTVVHFTEYHNALLTPETEFNVWSCCYWVISPPVQDFLYRVQYKWPIVGQTLAEWKKKSNWIGGINFLPCSNVVETQDYVFVHCPLAKAVYRLITRWYNECCPTIVSPVWNWSNPYEFYCKPPWKPLEREQENILNKFIWAKTLYCIWLARCDSRHNPEKPFSVRTAVIKFYIRVLAFLYEHILSFPSHMCCVWGHLCLRPDDGLSWYNCRHLDNRHILLGKEYIL